MDSCGALIFGFTRPQPEFSGSFAPNAGQLPQSQSHKDRLHVPCIHATLLIGLFQFDNSLQQPVDWWKFQTQSSHRTKVLIGPAGTTTTENLSPEHATKS